MKARVYAGEVLLRAGTAESFALVELARQAIARELGAPIESAQHRMTAQAHYEAVSRVRAALATSPEILRATRSVVTSLGLDNDRCALDVLRLRANRHEGDLIPEASAAYTAHRDTWFANPRSQINVWIPLHDVASDETFVIYPSAFGTRVANDSASFDYDVFRRAVGFQGLAKRTTESPGPVVYPTATEAIDASSELRFAARAGDLLVFSGAHLHRPLGHRSGRTRFSVDFRVVDLDDHARRLGAPEVDGEARGSALVDYVMPTAVGRT